ncbi:MAG: hypothetical protein AB7U29_18615 [Desulfobulbus sp.]
MGEYVLDIERATYNDETAFSHTMKFKVSIDGVLPHPAEEMLARIRAPIVEWLIDFGNRS